MNNKKEFDLLSDLAKLISKYGPEVFESVANEISKPEFAERLVEVLKTSAKVYRTIPKVERKSRSHSLGTAFRSTLTSMSRSDAEKAALLIELYEALKSHGVLPTLREMKNFAIDNGLPPLKSTSREKALIPFVKAFIPLPVEDVRERLQRIKPSPSDDRTLDGWSRVIFGKDEIRRRA